MKIVQTLAQSILFIAGIMIVPLTLLGQTSEDGWEVLFDGQSMEKWRVYNEEGIRGWELRDGEMVALGQAPSADIITLDTYSNFDLIVEWAISKGGNSGIFFNVVERADLGAVYYTGPEYQLLDDVAYPNISARNKSGSNYDMHEPSEVPVKPQGEYNTSRIRVVNGHVEHWLNGVKVVSYNLWSDEWNERVQGSKWKNYPLYGKAKSGHLALQDHGNEIRFKNVRVKRL